MPDCKKVIECLESTIHNANWANKTYTECDVGFLTEVFALLKARKPREDWISRKRLKDEIQYYIDEAGWGDEVNKALGWCLEFIDNQRAVTWNDA